MAAKTKRSEMLKRRYGELRAKRGTWDTQFRDVARYVYPEQDEFWQTFTNSSHGERKGQWIFDSTAPQALIRFSSIMESLLVPRAQKWHGLQAENLELREDRDVQLYFDEVTRRLFQQRYAPKANFQSQMNETFMSLGSFGTGAVFIDRKAGEGIRYKSCFIGDIYIDVNFQGSVDTVYRRFDYSNQQAVQRWGKDAPEKVLKEVEEKPYERSEYLHVVLPNNEIMPDRLDFKGMPFSEVYISLDSVEEMGEGGYLTMPYAVSRYITSANELYGRSPAMAVLADIKTLNDMAETDLEAVHKIVDPPLLIHDDGILGAGSMQVDLRSGGQNFGGVSADGRPLIIPLQTGARVDINEQKMQVKRDTINAAFLVDLFQILVQTPRMSATEAMIRAQEKGALLAPVGRQESELLGAIIEREIEVLAESGNMPEPPQSLVDDEGNYEIIYDSPLSRLQRSEELIGIQRTQEMAIASAAYDEGKALRMLDTERILIYTRDGNGAPTDIIKSPERIEAEEAQQQQQQQQQIGAQEAAQGASALKDVAQAQNLLQRA